MDLRANTAVDVLIGPHVDSTDGNTTEEGLTIEDEHVLLSKNGQALTAKNDANNAAHDDEGYYNCPLNTTDTNTEGNLVLITHITGALPVRHEFNILSEAAWDSLYVAKDDGYMDVNIKAISEDTTAADNSEAFFDGTGYAGTNNVIPTVTTLTGHTAQTGDSYARIGAAGAGLTEAGGDGDHLTAIDLPNQTMDITGNLSGSVGSVTGNVGGDVVGNVDGTVTGQTPADAGDVADALTAINLDHLMKTAVANNADMTAEVTDGSVLSNIMTKGSDTSDFTVADDSLEAIRDRGDAEWITATSVTVSDKTGFALSAAGIDAIWNDASALTLDFGTLLERVYQLIQNKINITDADGSSDLRIIGDGGSLATWTISDDDTTTTRTEASWA